MSTQEKSTEFPPVNACVLLIEKGTIKVDDPEKVIEDLRNLKFFSSLTDVNKGHIWMSGTDVRTGKATSFTFKCPDAGANFLRARNITLKQDIGEDRYNRTYGPIDEEGNQIGPPLGWEDKKQTKE